MSVLIKGMEMPSVDFCKKWKEYDTVLVDAEQYEAYCRIADLPLEPPKKTKKSQRRASDDKRRKVQRNIWFWR